MKNVSVQQFIKLRKQLEKERAKIIERLQEVDAALGAFKIATTPAATKPAAAPRKRVSNEMSLKEAIVKVASGKTMTKEEILQGITKLGYKFRTSNPLNSMNVVLYGKKPKFKVQDGKFTLS